MIKRVFQLLIVLAMLVAAFGSAGEAFAWGNCAQYITVQWGDTLSGIAVQCGSTVNAIRLANPGLGWWVYAGQVLYIPSGTTSVPVSHPTSGGTYMVQPGDTLGKIAARIGCSLNALLTANPQIHNPSLIFAGQVINLPTGAKVPSTPPPPPPCNCSPSPTGNSLSSLKIAFKGGMFIRTVPNGSIISSALNKETVFYFPGSITVDSKGRVWVQVKLFTSVPGHPTGWLLVKDQFGTFFTDPQISPKIDP